MNVFLTSKPAPASITTCPPESLRSYLRDVRDGYSPSRVVGVDFAGHDFSNLAVDGIDFVDCRFTGAVLDGALFRFCTFERTSFDGVSMRRTGFHCVTFEDVTCGGATLHNVEIAGLHARYVAEQLALLCTVTHLDLTVSRQDVVVDPGCPEWTWASVSSVLPGNQ